MHHRELLRFHEWCSVAFTQLVTILPNEAARRLQDEARRRALDVPGRRGARGRSHFEIDEYTDTHHDYAVVPHTVILSPGLVIEKVYVGYWFWGRPSRSSSGIDLGEIHARIKPDFDPTLFFFFLFFFFLARPPGGTGTWSLRDRARRTARCSSAELTVGFEFESRLAEERTRVGAANQGRCARLEDGTPQRSGTSTTRKPSGSSNVRPWAAQ